MTAGDTAGSGARYGTLRAAVEQGPSISQVKCARCGDTQVLARRTVLADVRRTVKCGRCGDLLARVGNNATAKWIEFAGISDQPFPQVAYDAVLRSPASR